MINFDKHKQELLENGFSILEGIYSIVEVDSMLAIIDNADTSKDIFRKSAGLFAIRQFLKEFPQAVELIFNDSLRLIVEQIIGHNSFVVKCIFFDKPKVSNWYVSYHQDLTISVDKRVELENFGPWTVKQHQFAVQPSLDILEDITTIRIHLDDTDEDNGALRVISRSHLKKIYRPETISWDREVETTCVVGKGGIMLMKPLTLHCSGRTTNNKQRRVIHIEFCGTELPGGLKWAERINFG